MNMACSSVLRGGGTNQELVLHCLHECGGDFLVSSYSQSYYVNLLWRPTLIKTLKYTLTAVKLCSFILIHTRRVGDFKETLGRLMLQDTVFPKGHALAAYHYSGEH